MKAYGPSWAQKNRDKLNEKSRKYRATMTPEQKAKNAERNRIAREKKRIEEGRPKRVPKPKKEQKPKKQPMSAEEKAAKARDSARANYYKDPKKSIEKVMKWRVANPEKAKQQRKRRHKKLKSEGRTKPFTPEVKDRLKKYGRKPETVREKKRLYRLRCRHELRDSHVARTMGLQASICPKDLIEAKRELIRAKRQLREQHQPEPPNAPEP